ncbi:MAG TPA: S-methyl-5-thioribose-1-phosphate isomerase [Ktedonobacterales bacterium]|nr:S-methyl-5-thioribose-1-phosphate isomerase [Ktedonobacterales bacterium]
MSNEGPFSDEGLPRALWWDDAAGALRLIDQTLLPGRCEVIACATEHAVAEAIRALRVRGAPAIGVAAAYGLALAARALIAEARGIDGTAALERLRDDATSLRATRPTAVNLAWALERMLAVADHYLAEGGSVRELPDALLAEAGAIAAEDAAACAAMGRLGAELIADGDTLLTHCNAGALATAGMGTALAPIYTAHRAGKRLHVYVDETRPVLQGARLTAWELARAGVPITLITDNMAAHFMKRGGVRAVFVGADRIAANGDTANKIGTYGLALLAHAHAIPFYVVAPRSTVDLARPDGDAIPIEERAPDEVTTIRGVRVAPEGVRVANPAFDVTPARYISAILTESGIARPPYVESLRTVAEMRAPSRAVEVAL